MSVAVNFLYSIFDNMRETLLWTRTETDWLHLISLDLKYNCAPECSFMVLKGGGG